MQEILLWTFLCISVCWQHVRIQRLMERLQRLEQERDMWALAAEMYSEEAQRNSYNATG